MLSFQRSFGFSSIGSDVCSPFPSARSEPHEPYLHASPVGTTSKSYARVQALDFSRLHSFETVNNQFQADGIEFAGAIALQPSNPIFWTHRQAIVIMPAASHQSVQMQFHQPVHQFCISVVGVREVRMIATGGDRAPVIQRSPKPNRTFRTPNDLIEPLVPHRLELNGEAATAIRLESSHPFVISAVLFGFIGIE